MNSLLQGASLSRVGSAATMPLHVESTHPEIVAGGDYINDARRHFEGGNVAFADGHVKFIKRFPLVSIEFFPVLD
jgi:prepilin-type processing-associated H-X9-DG protein